MLHPYKRYQKPTKEYWAEKKQIKTIKIKIKLQP
jgi:hypothetical protein